LFSSESLIEKPFSELVQEYTTCTYQASYVFLSQLGAAMGTLDILIPLAIVLTLSVSFLYQKLWKDPIPKSYSKEEKEAVLEDLAVSLLLTKDHINLLNGNVHPPKNKVVEGGSKDDSFGYEQVYDTENPKLSSSSVSSKLEKNSLSVVQFSNNPLLTSSESVDSPPNHIMYQLVDALSRDEEFHNDRYKLAEALNGLQVEGNDELLVETRQVVSSFSNEVNKLRRKLKKIKCRKTNLLTSSQRFSSRTVALSSSTPSTPSSPVPTSLSEQSHIIILNSFDDLSSFKLSQYPYFKTEEGILYELNRLIQIFQVTSQDLFSSSEGTGELGIGLVDHEKINKLFESTHFLQLISDDFLQISPPVLKFTASSSKRSFFQQFLPKLYELLLSHILLHLDYYSNRAPEETESAIVKVEQKRSDEDDDKIPSIKQQPKKILNFENYSIQNEIVYKVGTKTFWSLEDINSLRNKFE
jgi:hypothetical protein